MSHLIDSEALKKLVLDAAEKSLPVAEFDGDEVLFGPDSRLELDSIDALQISMAIQKHYGIRLKDSKETRRAMGSINLLAAFLSQSQ